MISKARRLSGRALRRLSRTIDPTLGIGGPGTAHLTSHVAPALDVLYRSPRLEDHAAAAAVYQQAQERRLGRAKALPDPSLTVAVDAALPALAWRCVVDQDGHRFTVGSRVERGEDFVYEGVWDGPFAERGIDLTDRAYGSGARVRDEAVVFVPPKHCWEHLYLLVDRAAGRTIVANSLLFALASGGVTTDHPFFTEVAAVLRTGTDAATAAGIDRYDPVVAEDRDRRLLRMMFTNFSVTPEGRLRLYPSAPQAPYDSFDGYRSHLRATVALLGANAMAPQRAHPLRPLTPISNGYDSPAVASIASHCGFLDAITIHAEVKGHLDSGAEIGALLGMDVERVPHVLGERLPKLGRRFDGEHRDLVAEFVAPAGLGDDVMLKSFEPHLPGRMLLTGQLGDVAWKRPHRLPPGLPVRIPYGKSATEFRLRVGFALVPVPAIDARFAWPLRSITYAEEMAPYTLKAPYDRPIARRLIEEAGVPRGTFAVAKRAMQPTVVNHEELFRPSVDTVMRRYRSACPV